MKKTYLTLILIITGICLFIGGYTLGFSNGYETNGLVKRFVEASEDFIWLCSDYDSPYYKCDPTKQFQNITGFYCDNKLVCQNQLRKDCICS